MQNQEIRFDAINRQIFRVLKEPSTSLSTLDFIESLRQQVLLFAEASGIPPEQVKHFVVQESLSQYRGMTVLFAPAIVCPQGASDLGTLWTMQTWIKG